MRRWGSAQGVAGELRLSELIDRWFLWVAVGLALATRALSRGELFNDGPRFITQAEAFLRGDWRAAIGDAFHPLASLLMAGTSWLLGISLETAGHWLSIGSGAVAVLATYSLVRAGFDVWLARGAALLVALHPQLVVNSTGPRSDGICLALLLTAAWAGWRALGSGGAVWAIGAGLSCGLAYLARPEGLAVAVVFAGWIALEVLRRARPLSGALSLLAAFALSLGAIAGPYLVAMRAVHGEWSLTQKKSASAMLGVDRTPTAPDATSTVAPANPSGAAQDGVTEAHKPRSRWSLQRVRRGLREVVTDGYRAFQPFFLVLLALGLLRGRPQRATRYLLAYMGLFAGMLIALRLSAGYVSRRHWLSVVALCTPFMARGGLRAWQAALLALPSLREARWAPASAAAVVVAGLLAWSVLPDPGQAKEARREAAEWLRAARAPEAVATHRSRDAYYAGARFVSVYGIAAAELLRASSLAKGAPYVVLDLGEYSGNPAELRGIGQELHRVDYGSTAVVVLELNQELSAR